LTRRRWAPTPMRQQCFDTLRRDRPNEIVVAQLNRRLSRPGQECIGRRKPDQFVDGGRPSEPGRGQDGTTGSASTNGCWGKSTAGAEVRDHPGRFRSRPARKIPPQRSRNFPDSIIAGSAARVAPECESGGDEVPSHRCPAVPRRMRRRATREEKEAAMAEGLAIGRECSRRERPVQGAQVSPPLGRVPVSWSLPSWSESSGHGSGSEIGFAYPPFCPGLAGTGPTATDHSYLCCSTINTRLHKVDSPTPVERGDFVLRGIPVHHRETLPELRPSNTTRFGKQAKNARRQRLTNAGARDDGTTRSAQGIHGARLCRQVCSVQASSSTIQVFHHPARRHSGMATRAAE